VYVYVYACVCMYVCMHAGMHTCMNACLCVRVRMYACMTACLVTVCLHVNVFVYVCVCMCACALLCVQLPFVCLSLFPRAGKPLEQRPAPSPTPAEAAPPTVPLRNGAWRLPSKVPPAWGGMGWKGRRAPGTPRLQRKNESAQKPRELDALHYVLLLCGVPANKCWGVEP
jgi:hypothetical protein